MRTLFVVSLALVLVALPAAQAAACRCAEESPAGDAPPTCSCCGTAPGDCGCCPEGDSHTQRAERDCGCSLPSPQTSEPPVVEIPVPAARIDAGVAEPAMAESAGAQRTLERGGDPHPEVLLPLLL